MTTGESWAKRKSDRWLSARVVAACLSMWLAPAAGARDLTEILKDKGVLSDDEAELIQIDENLIRANLSDAERILHVARRKELYEKLHPETKHGGDRRSAGAKSSSQNENLKAFVADIAVKTGKGRSTVARDVTRAKKVAVLDDIAGTCLALGKLPEGEQRKLATAARAGEKVSAKARKPRQKGADTAVRLSSSAPG